MKLSAVYVNLAIAALTCLAGLASAQTYPDRPVKVMMPWADGFPANATRLYGRELSARYRHPRCRTPLRMTRSLLLKLGVAFLQLTNAQIRLSTESALHICCPFLSAIGRCLQAPRRPLKVLHLWPPKLLHPGRGDLTH